MYQEMLVGMTGAMMGDVSATAKNTKEMVKEIADLKVELEQTRNELTSYKTEQKEQREADARQAVIDKKKDRRHELLVACFTCLFTLALEHIRDIVQALKVALEFIGALFH